MTDIQIHYSKAASDRLGLAIGNLILNWSWVENAMIRSIELMTVREGSAPHNEPIPIPDRWRERLGAFKALTVKYGDAEAQNHFKRLNGALGRIKTLRDDFAHGLVFLDHTEPDDPRVTIHRPRDFGVNWLYQLRVSKIEADIAALTKAHGCVTEIMTNVARGIDAAKDAPAS